MARKISFGCGLFLLLTIVAISSGEEEKKQLKLVLDKLEKVKDAAHIVKTDLTFDKDANEEVKINGQVDLLVDLDNNYKLNMEISHSTDKDGEFKKAIGAANLGVCDVMANQYKKYFHESLKNYANAPDPDICPVPMKTYVVKDYPLDSSKIQKYLRPGFYKIVSSLMNNDEEILQYVVEAHTEEE